MQRFGRFCGYLDLGIGVEIQVLPLLESREPSSFEHAECCNLVNRRPLQAHLDSRWFPYQLLLR